MFNFYPSNCPLDIHAKEWIENRLCWLSEEFGYSEFINSPVIIPTREFFVLPKNESYEEIQKLFHQVCNYMKVDPDSVLLNIVEVKQPFWFIDEKGKVLPTIAAGLFDHQEDQTIIHISSFELLNISDLIGTMAHELAHVRILREERASYDEFDNELLTDLTTVFFKLGIFTANSPRVHEVQFSTWPDSNVRRSEYMNLPMFAYALAHLAWHQNEKNPAWSKFLSWDITPSFRQCVRFLFKTHDSNFKPANVN